jgi:hypothetical protein
VRGRHAATSGGLPSTHTTCIDVVHAETVGDSMMQRLYAPGVRTIYGDPGR